MEDPSNGVVKRLGLRERLVPALMCNNPETGGSETRRKSVQRPEREAGGGVEPWAREREGLGVDEGVEVRGGLPEDGDEDKVLQAEGSTPGQWG